MKEGTRVITENREGVLIFVDTPWNLADGTPADLLCRVKFDDGKSSPTNGWYKMSELKLSENQEPPKKSKEMKEQIDFSQFLEIEKKLEIKLGTITTVERVPKSDKMLKLTVSFGEEERTVMTNIGNQVEPDALSGKQLPFVTNLKPAKIMGVESTAMIMVPSIDGKIDISESPVSGSKLL